jgi:hypothetical protein
MPKGKPIVDFVDVGYDDDDDDCFEYLADSMINVRMMPNEKTGFGIGRFCLCSPLRPPPGLAQ